MKTLTFGAWVRSKRGRRGEPGFITQEELGRRIGVKRPRVVQIEGSEETPSYDVRKRIHEALGTSERELIELGIVNVPRGNRPNPHPDYPGPSDALVGATHTSSSAAPVGADQIAEANPFPLDDPRHEVVEALFDAGAVEGFLFEGLAGMIRNWIGRAAER